MADMFEGFEKEEDENLDPLAEGKQVSRTTYWIIVVAGGLGLWLIALAFLGLLQFICDLTSRLVQADALLVLLSAEKGWVGLLHLLISIGIFHGLYCAYRLYIRPQDVWE